MKTYSEGIQEIKAGLLQTFESECRKIGIYKASKILGVHRSNIRRIIRGGAVSFQNLAEMIDRLKGLTKVDKDQ